MSLAFAGALVERQPVVRVHEREVGYEPIHGHDLGLDSRVVAEPLERDPGVDDGHDAAGPPR